VLLVARLSAMDSARLRRDLGLARARRITVTVAIGATGFTAVTALVAATSLPGHTVGSTNALAQQASTGTLSSGSVQPGLTGPAQVPQYGYGGTPVAVSGGS